jgi:hypothetical protein
LSRELKENPWFIDGEKGKFSPVASRRILDLEGTIETVIL